MPGRPISWSARPGQSQERNDFAAAIDDYTHGSGSRTVVTRSRCGGGDGLTWPQVLPNCAAATLRKQSALILPSGDVYSGRGSALVALGRCREAVTDAEESLRHGESDARMHYKLLPVSWPRPPELTKQEPRPRKPSERTKAQIYQDRALTLLAQAVERTPPEGRLAFWRNVVHSDRVFTPIRRLPAYTRIAASVGVPQAH